MSTETPSPTELLLTVADIIEQYPEVYDQSDWGTGKAAIATRGRVIECGTTACIAGHVVAAAGAKPIIREMYDYDLEEYVDVPTWTLVDYQGNRHSTEYHAAELLELGVGDASTLFGSGWEPNAYDNVPDALRALANGTDVYDL